MHHDLGLNTLAAQSLPPLPLPVEPLSVPIHQGTNYRVATSEALGELFARKADGVYTRFGHPTLSAAARQLARLEGAESALVFSSGMAAVTSALMAVLRAGDRVVSQRQIFAQTFTFLDTTLRGYGVDTTFLDPRNPDDVAQLVDSRTRLVYLETPSNPLLEVVDLAATMTAVRRRNPAVLVFVDGTFATPVLQRPLELGASLVIHSGSKYLNGHSDVLCGAVAGPATLVERVKAMQILLGGILDPHAAWLLLRGMKTLPLRVRRQCETAWALARCLEGRPGVLRVHYPFLESSPYRDIARRQMRAGGAMVSFEVVGGLAGARRFVNALRLIPIATSLGGVESVVEVPYELDWADAEMTRPTVASAVPQGLIRLSVGLEDLGDLEGDLALGIEALGTTEAAGAAGAAGAAERR